MAYAKTTEVSTARSKAEIEATVERYGASQFISGWDTGGQAMVGFTMGGRQVRFVLSMPDPTEKRFTTHIGVPYYTASLDAAMSLVPEGWVWSMNTFADPAKASCYCMNHRNEMVRSSKQYVATPALALCAASLRARANKENDRGD